jgi:hypothetical protein
MSSGLFTIEELRSLIIPLGSLLSIIGVDYHELEEYWRLIVTYYGK